MVISKGYRLQCITACLVKKERNHENLMPISRSFLVCLAVALLSPRGTGRRIDWWLLWHFNRRPCSLPLASNIHLLVIGLLYERDWWWSCRPKLPCFSNLTPSLLLSLFVHDVNFSSSIQRSQRFFQGRLLIQRVVYGRSWDVMSNSFDAWNWYRLHLRDLNGPVALQITTISNKQKKKKGPETLNSIRCIMYV